MIARGMKDGAIDLIPSYWGGMVEAGADTFWEVYDPADPALVTVWYGSYQQRSPCLELYASLLHSHHGYWELAQLGLYGMLGLGLMLFSLRALRLEFQGKNRLLTITFWSINFGLARVLLSQVSIRNPDGVGERDTIPKPSA
jgi:hypothetical protein